MTAETSVARAPAGSSPSAPLRVALITSSYNYIQDGVALTLNRLVAYLESRGVEVLVFAPVGASPAFEHNGEVVAVPSLRAPLRPEYRLALGLTRRPRERLLAFRPDILHIAVPDLLGHQAQRLALKMGWPVVASYHTRYETYLKYYGLAWLRGPLTGRLGAFYAACREVYAPSPSMAEVLVAQGAGGNVRLWPRGIDTVRFHPRKRNGSWRAAHGIGGAEVVVAYVGRLVKEKGVSEVAEVFERLRAAGIAHRGLIVGDGPERENLERRIPEAVFTGFLGGEALASAYACADIFLFPSDTETFGAVTLEAMASGLPAVCADATGSRSLVEAGVTGFLVEPGDGEAFYQPVAALARDPALRAKMGAAARERSLLFSWEEAMGGLLGRYEAVLGLAKKA